MRNMLWLIAACPLAGCAAPAPVGAPAQSVGMANPASQFCIDQGGRLEIRDGPDGQSGYCHLRDGTVVEEWAFFRAHHPAPGS